MALVQSYVIGQQSLYFSFMAKSVMLDMLCQLLQKKGGDAVDTAVMQIFHFFSFQKDI